MERLWNTSFVHQIEQGAYNTAPVEAIVRSVAHHFRAKGFTTDDCGKLKFLEVGAVQVLILVGWQSKVYE